MGGTAIAIAIVLAMILYLLGKHGLLKPPADATSLSERVNCENAADGIDCMVFSVVRCERQGNCKLESTQLIQRGEVEILVNTHHALGIEPGMRAAARW